MLFFENKDDEPNRISYSSLFSQMSQNIDNLPVNNEEENKIYLFNVSLGSIYYNQPISFNLLPNYIVGIKFLNFPSLKFQGNILPFQHRIEIKDSKSIVFIENNLHLLKKQLKNSKLSLVIIDLTQKQIIASAQILLNSFATDQFLNYNSLDNFVIPQPKTKNIILFDQITDAKWGEIEMTLVIRKEYYFGKSNNKKPNPNYEEKTTKFYFGIPDEKENHLLTMYAKTLLDPNKINNLQKGWDYEEINKKRDNKFIENEPEYKVEERQRHEILKEKFIGKHLPLPNPIYLYHKMKIKQEEDQNEEKEEIPQQQITPSILEKSCKMNYVKAQNMYQEVSMKDLREKTAEYYINERQKRANEGFVNYDQFIRDKLISLSKSPTNPVRIISNEKKLSPSKIQENKEQLKSIYPQNNNDNNSEKNDNKYLNPKISSLIDIAISNSRINESIQIPESINLMDSRNKEPYKEKVSKHEDNISESIHPEINNICNSIILNPTVSNNTIQTNIEGDKFNTITHDHFPSLNKSSESSIKESIFLNQNQQKVSPSPRYSIESSIPYDIPNIRYQSQEQDNLSQSIPIEISNSQISSHNPTSRAAYHVQNTLKSIKVFGSIESSIVEEEDFSRSGDINN